MWHKIEKKKSIFNMLFWLFVCLIACESFAQTQTLEKESSSDNVVLTALSGFGSFQDIQVPESDVKGFRGDGTSAVSENQDHFGLPLGVKLSVGSDDSALGFYGNLSVLRINTMSGPPETASSSYSRFGFGLGSSIRWYFDEAKKYNSFIRAEIEARRSSYNNVSSGHFVNALLPKLILGLEKPKSWAFQVFGAMGANVGFGYGTGFSLGGRTFKNAETSMREFGVQVSFQVYKKTWLGFGIEEEAVDVKIDNIVEYNTFGLSVAESRDARIYNLRTKLFQVNLQKRF